MNRPTFRSSILVAAVAMAASPLSAQALKYVALGDSLTAGFQSGCLVQRNQVNSYPAVLARSFEISDFQQPLVQEVALTNPPGTVCLGAIFVPPATVTVGPVSQMDGPLNALLPRPYDNLGIPGADVADLLTLTHGDPNGSSLEKTSALVLRNVPGSPFDGTNALQQANVLLGAATGPKLVSLWIGNNNVLGASTSGIVVDGVTLVSVDDFRASYEAVVGAIPPGTGLVAANILDVTAIPFSTTIPPILVNPATRQPVIIDGHTVPLLGEGDDAFPCVLTGGPDLGCPLPAGTLVNLPASALLAQGVGIPAAAGGTGLPLPHGHIDATGAHGGVTVYPDEVALLQQRTAEYNAVIASAIGSGTLVDTNARFSDIKAHGYHIGGLTLTASFVTGGLFSYDGVHPSSIGYAIVADEFIQALNASGNAYPRPDISTALFAPNVPTVGAAVRGGGPWGYDFGMWSELLATIPTARGMSVQLPSSPDPHSGGRTTRVVTRGPGD